MAQFRYKARNVSGDIVKGLVDSSSPKEAAQTLIQTGITPITIESAGRHKSLLARTTQWIAVKRLSLADIAIFSRQMYSLTKAGIPLIRSLSSLADTSRNNAMSSTLRSIVNSIESGHSLAFSMSLHSSIFSPLYVSLIKMGENAGKLDQAFLQNANFLERERLSRERIKTAMRYPLIVLIALSFATVLLNFYVVPSFKHIFDKFHTELPLATKVLIASSDSIRQYWPVWLLLIIATLFCLIKLLQSRQGRLKWDQLILQIPTLGNIFERAAMERFSRAFSMILNSNIPLLQGLRIVARSIGNEYIASKLEKLSFGIEKGESISRMAFQLKLFPPLVSQMIMVGEETGNISKMLEEVADFYQVEVDADLKNLSSLIEPLLIFFVSLLVLGLALGIFLPMWELSTTVRH
ncbi:MAG: type II secretion system F family protein [Methylococcaceae bacterium]